MIRTISSAAAAAVGLAVLCTAGAACTCNESRTARVERSGAPQDTPGAAKKAPPPRSARTPMKTEMRRMMKLAVEMRRRAAAGVVVRAPARMIAAEAGKLPVNSYPGDFHGLNEDLKRALKRLDNTKNHRADYNAMVKACVACHRHYDTDTVKQLQGLLLAPPRPAPAEKKPK